jgi:flagellar hook-length control protein FliK
VVANEVSDTNAGDLALTMKEPELPQNSTANKQKMQNPATNHNTETTQPNGKETANIAPSPENAKSIKEAVVINENQKPVMKTSSIVGEGNKNEGKAKNSVFPQQNSSAKAKGGEISEISMNSKQAAKRQVSGNPDVVKAVEEGAKSKASTRIDGVTSPLSGINNSNGQAAPVNNVTVPSQSRWDSLMQFVQRIMQNAHIQHRQEGISELRVRMASETLGKLTVHLSVIDNHVDVRFALDTLQARQVMQSHKAELTQILRDNGASSVNIDVTTSSTDGEERFRQFSETGDRYGRPDFHSGLVNDDDWGFTEGLNQESELASPVTRTNLSYEHSSMVWVA